MAKMKGTPKVSVITRTKDRPLFLERAIKSVHNQTMTDFVHVIFNDGGDKDEIDSLVEKYKTLASGRIKVVHNYKTSGGADTILTQAVRYSDSFYVAIHDDDDTWHPEFLERTTQLIEEKNAMGVVAHTDKVFEEVLDTDHEIRIIKKEQYLPDVKTINLYRQCIDNQMTPITFVYRRSAFDELGGYDDSLPVCGDWDFGIRFLLKYDVEFLDPGFALANYHHRKYRAGDSGNSTFGSSEEKHRYWSNKLMNKYLRQELNEGRLGVGYIMSELRYDRGGVATMIKRVLPNFAVKHLKRRVQS